MAFYIQMETLTSKAITHSIEKFNGKSVVKVWENAVHILILRERERVSFEIEGDERDKR